MDEKELEALLAKVQEASKKAANEANTEQFEALQKQIEDLKKEANNETMKTELVRLAGELKALQEKPKDFKTEGHKTMRGALLAALKEKSEDIKALLEDVKKGGRGYSLSVELKESGSGNGDTIGLFNTIEAGDTQVTITQNTGIISAIRKRELRYLANVSVGSIGTSRAMWVEETDEHGAPLFIGEGEPKPGAKVLYVERTQDVRKVAVFTKMTTELLEDLPQLVSYIQRNLTRRLDIKVENDLFKGNGLGDNLKGSFEYATAFTGASLAGEVEMANELDVLEAIALQCKEANGFPESVFVHPSTMSKIRLIKEQGTGRPIWKDYVTPAGEFNYSGLRVIETLALTPGEFIGGETSVINVLNRSGLRVQIGLDGNDFTNNKNTLLLEKRLVQFVSANDTPVLIKGTFATAIPLIDKAS
jgi:HK97 family phage major capsid protein